MHCLVAAIRKDTEIYNFFPPLKRALSNLKLTRCSSCDLHAFAREKNVPLAEGGGKKEEELKGPVRRVRPGNCPGCNV